jgi:hypothetical protein
LLENADTVGNQTTSMMMRHITFEPGLTKCVFRDSNDNPD